MKSLIRRLFSKILKRHEQVRTVTVVKGKDFTISYMGTQKDIQTDVPKLKSELQKVNEALERVREETIRERWLPPPKPVVRRGRRLPRRKPRSSAVHHDVSRFMKKHGRWSKEYRASVKARAQPEED